LEKGLDVTVDTVDRGLYGRTTERSFCRPVNEGGTMGNLAVVEGHGDTRVLVLHGWALDSAVWLASRSEIDLERFTYAFLDFSGYGSARDQAPASGIDGMAAEAIAAADELGWDTFAVLGHSMGGTTAIRVGTLAPDRVTAVVSLTPVSPSGTPLDAATYEGFRSAYPDSGPTLGGLGPHLSARQLQNIVSRSHEVLDQGVWDAYLANWTAADFGDSLALYGGPVTLAYGDSDPFVTKEYLEGTAQALKNVSLVPIESAGHYPEVEQTVQTVRLWEDALTNETGRQSA
jgi:pimeloyl-ACP methyl ester carboxylesterase